MRMPVQLGARLVKRGLAWLRAWPWFVGSIVLGFLIKENFPFSHWPMYSNFAPSSAYVYVVNGEGAPLAIATFFETAPRLRRQFEREWKAGLKARDARAQSEADIEREAATHVLERLARRLPPDERAAAGRLGLVRANLKMDETRAISVSERTLAMIEFDGIPFTPPPQGSVPRERH
ncbi:MAG TPA: hypothetical protein VFO90_04780 [Terrimicrobiaceae bacterium]|jgi:hypothetical protein|nr:hypothetical protein [Terrimicrobiaceae bacterium]